MIKQKKLSSFDGMCDIKSIKKFLMLKPLRVVLENGGFIAGGFPLRCFREAGVPVNYLQQMNRSIVTGRFDFEPDIDFFFRTKEDFDKANDALSMKHSGVVFYHSTPNAVTYTMKLLSAQGVDIGTTCNVQLINLAFRSPEDTLCSFDLINSMIAFDVEDVWYDDLFWSLLTSDTIRVSNLMGSRTIKRIGKYFAKHGFKRIDDKTKDCVLNWAIVHFDERDAQRAIAALEFGSGGKAFLDDELLYFMNKFTVNVSAVDAEEYEDFVMVALKKRIASEAKNENAT